MEHAESTRRVESRELREKSFLQSFQSYCSRSRRVQILQSPRHALRSLRKSGFAQLHGLYGR